MNIEKFNLALVVGFILKPISGDDKVAQNIVAQHS